MSVETTPAPSRAVFLSYAREDTDASRRIADALRGFGIEVWFDQSELRGGDAWDQKIRSQIKACALFVPVISAHTESRGEGYFRLEWKLADERTHLMAKGVPFLVPVVVDDTTEAEAMAPDSFSAVQWTRLPGGVPTPEFVAHVKRLLEAPRRAVHSGAAAAGLPAVGLAKERAGGWDARGERNPAGSDLPAVASATAGDPVLQKPKPRGRPLAWAAAVAVVVLGGGAYFALRPAAKPPPAAVPTTALGSVPLSPSLSPSLSPLSPSVPQSLPPSAKSIAVLPFANYSSDATNAYFADGLHDEVITALAKIHDLKVISRTSVMAYRDAQNRNLRKIAADLGVACILEGSVQRAGNQVHLNVQLIDARTDEHLWADSYTRDVTDIFSAETELATAVTTALKSTLSPDEKSLISRRPTRDAQAYDLYLHAMALSESVGSEVSRQRFDEIIGLLDQAVARDPSFVNAQAQLCLFNGIMYWFGSLDPTPERQARAKRALDAAVLAGPDLAETKVARGAYDYLCENDWAQALAQYQAAQPALPNDAQLLFLIGVAQRRLGQFDATLHAFARSAELNPRDYSAPPQQVETLVALRRFAEAREKAAYYVEVFPGKTVMQALLAQAQLGVDGDVAAFLRRVDAVPPPDTDPFGLIAAYRRALRHGDLKAAAAALADPRTTSVPSPEGVVSNPVALHRAQIAFLAGDRATARAFALEALAAYHRQHWSPRQQPFVNLGVAIAKALAGDREGAAREGRTAAEDVAQHDAFLAGDAQLLLGDLFITLDERDKAFACLAKAMAEPCDVTPAEVRIGAFWSRLKDDPRFEQILRSAKQL